MIRIGLGERQKQKVVREYLKSHEIRKIFCFYYEKFPLQIKADCEVEYVEYADIEMYKYFYRLLEEIDDKVLLVFNECMRTQNRSELIYNCAHHYCNQTPHKIVFEYFPIIEDKNDFMILLDFINKGKYKGKSFDYMFLQDEDIKIRPRKIRFDSISVDVTEKDKARYEEYKEKLFANLGNKNPDTIPRNLQIFAGNLKKKAIEPNKQYVARNKRFKLDNVLSYQEIEGRGDYIVIDTHYRRLNMNDFLKTTGMTRIRYLNTMLTIDSYIATEFIKWKARVDAIYAQASLY